MNFQASFNRGLLARCSPLFIAALLVVVTSFATRVALLLKAGPGLEHSPRNIFGLFSIGLYYDLVIASFVIIPFILQLWFRSDTIYAPRIKWIAIGFFVIFLSLLLFTNLVPADFNADVKRVLIAYVVLRFLIYLFLLFKTTTFRQKWRAAVLYVDFFLLIFLLLFNAVSEWFFWNEFSVRYNFIAVDYLVYTNEVLGNINQSYPIPAIIGIVLVVTTGIFLLVRSWIKASVYAPSTFGGRAAICLLLLAFAVLNYFTMREDWHHFSKNEYANELAANGVYQFGYSFFNNELDYFKFYKTLPDKEAFTIVRNDLQQPNVTFLSSDVFNLERQVSYPQPEQHKNVVLISIESFSASFMKAFGNTQNITPYLDSLAGQGLLFTNLYATGTRTVRGLEALSLALPPSAGQSIVKRPENENLFSLGSVFRSRGYNTSYIYGGYSYFDNMKHFFGGNDYTVIDRDSIPANQIHYQNIWGVADEDLFTLATNTIDRSASAGTPFFAHIMTVSNHRPYTYPEGRIDISPDTHSREGAVKYTDYAIHRFIRQAKTKSWFNNTIFVIVADHCAGSAGSVQLPVTGYHIPLIIYAPGTISTPGTETRLMSQIDIAPTILGLLHFNYKSKFLGRDYFNLPIGEEKAFISTYQGLGYLQHGQLVIQSPVRRVQQFKPDFTTGAAVEQPLSDSLVKKAIAYYQVSSWLIKHHKYGKVKQ